MEKRKYMAMENSETNESQIGRTIFSKQRYDKTDDDKPCFLDSPTLKSLASPPSTNEIIIIDDEEEEKITLEPEMKKPRLGSWCDNVEPLDDAVKRSPEAKEDSDVVLRADSYISSTDLQETKKKNDGEISLVKEKNKDSVNESTTRNKGYEHVTLEDLGVSIEDLKRIPWQAFDPTW